MYTTVTRLVSVVVLSVAGSFGHARAVNRSNSRSDIVRISAHGCAGGARRVGTGFVWHGANEIVTALHVIAGCQTATAYSEHDQVSYPLVVTHVLQRADLALLRAGNNAAFPPLAEGAGPASYSSLTAWGYGEATPAMHDNNLRVSHGAPTLRSNIPSDVAAAIATAGSPALDVRIVMIDDPIAPGLSGAPLLDANDHVRAIADGGVQHGITHVAWAIPASYLADLVTSNEQTSVYLVPTANLSAAEETRAEVYSADVVPANAPTIRCGNTDLRLARTRPFADVSGGTDSPGGLAQLVSIFGGAAPTFDLDIYEESKSGATVAFPAGSTITSGGNYCQAQLIGGQIEMRVQVLRGVPLQSVGPVSSQFEATVAPGPPLWLADPAWSYFQPWTRPDGLIVRRKAFARSFPQNNYGLPTDYLFETLAARNDTFIGSLGWRRNDLALYMCMGSIPGGPPCPTPDYVQVWEQTAVAVHLATFAVSAVGSNAPFWQQH